MKPKPMLKELSDLQIRDLLIARDERTTDWFYFVKCRPLFLSIIHKAYNYKIKYEEFVNEIYAYIMENDGKRLKTYDGSGSLLSWMKRTAYNQLLKIKASDLLIEDVSKEALNIDGQAEKNVTLEPEIARMDLLALIGKLETRNKRYAYVIKRAIIDDAKPEVIAKEIDVTVENYYNIKKRAIAELTAIAL